MGIFVDWKLAFEGDDEQLLLHLNRARSRIRKLPGVEVSEITRVDPVISPMILMTVEQHNLPIPPVVAERLRPIQEGSRDDQIEMLSFETFGWGNELKELQERWARPQFDLRNTTDLWRAEDYPAWIREGWKQPGMVYVRECLDEKPEDESFNGVTMNRGVILSVFADALLRYGYLFHVNPGEGSEWVSVALSAYRQEEKAPLFIGRGSAKTQYATNLEQAHRNVVETLDALQEEGLLLAAGDNSGYLEHRDWQKARRRIAAELAFTGLIGGSMTSLVRKAVGDPEADVRSVINNAATAFDRIEDMGVSTAEAFEALGDLIQERQEPEQEQEDESE